jgi:hypothetical protein
MGVFRIENEENNILRYGSDFSYDTEPGLSRSLLDQAALAGLDAVIGGQVVNWHQITAAEHAVRAIVFHDKPMLITPYFDASTSLGAGGKSPFRYGAAEQRHLEAISGVFSESGMSEMQIRADHSLFVFDRETEADEVDHFMRVPQSLPAPGASLDWDPARGDLVRLADDVEDYYGSYFPTKPDLVGQFLQRVVPAGSPLYFAAPHFRQTLAAFPENLGASYFKSIDIEWNQQADAWARQGIGPAIPPLLHIVMSRASTREGIAPELLALREEMAAPRAQLWDMFESVHQIADLETASHFIENLDREAHSIIPSALQSHRGRPILRFLFGWAKAAASWTAGGGLLQENYSLPRYSMTDAGRILEDEIAKSHRFTPVLARHLSKPELVNLGISQRDITLYSSPD